MMPWKARWLPALLLVAVASAASLLPGVFLLEREALADGEVWRLWTGHFVHHTAAHFVFDVGVAVFLFLLVRRPLAWLVLPPFVSGVVLAARPDLASYAGLSGMLHGLTVLAGVAVFRAGRGFERFAASALLVGVCAKAVYEATAGVSVFSGGFDMGAETIFVAHLAGVIGGLVMVGADLFRSGRSRRGGVRTPGAPAQPRPTSRRAGLPRRPRHAARRRCA